MKVGALEEFRINPVEESTLQMTESGIFAGPKPNQTTIFAS